MQRLRKLTTRTKTRIAKDKTVQVYLLFALFCLAVFLPYVIWGGLIYDDWSVAGLSRGCPGLIRSYSCFWGNYSDRPLAPLYYGILSNAFHGWSAGYFIASVGFWLTGVVTLFKVFKRQFGLAFATPFLFVAAIPSISSTILFSPAMQGVGAFTFMLWAFSLALLDRYIRAKQVRHLALSFVCIFLTMMLYESSLPLFGLSIAWPYIISRPPKRITFAQARDYFKKFILPILLIMVVVLAYQKLFIIHFTTDVSKFRVVNSSNVVNFSLRVLVNDLYIFTLGVTNFAGRGLLRLLKTTGPLMLVASLATIAVGLLGIRRGSLDTPKKKLATPWNTAMYAALGMIFLGIAAIHFVAVSPPTLVGYLNRGLVGGSIAVAIMAAMLWQRFAFRKTWVVVLWCLFFAGYTASFIIQRNNYVSATREQRRIGQLATQKIAETTNQDSMFVLSEVPTYLPKNFDNETIFSDEIYDWGNYLHLKAKNKTTGGISLSTERIRRGELVVEPGALLVMKSDKVDIKRIWFYDPATNELKKIDNESELATVLTKTTLDPKTYPLPVDAQLRNTIRDWLASY